MAKRLRDVCGLRNVSPSTLFQRDKSPRRVGETSGVGEFFTDSLKLKSGFRCRKAALFLANVAFIFSLAMPPELSNCCHHRRAGNIQAEVIADAVRFGLTSWPTFTNFFYFFVDGFFNRIKNLVVPVNINL
jgi:hypothetical protein